MAANTESKPGRNCWYEAGLRFNCVQGCVACCVTHGEHAYVYLENGDDLRLAEHLGLSRTVFLRRYTRKLDGYRILRMAEPSCVFLTGSGCAVYPARPTQCRTFPFWRENLSSGESWSELRGFCPGIDSGELHSPRRIENLAAERELGLEGER